MNDHPTILFQAPNGIGLGHISRLAAMAVAVRERAPQARLPFIVEGGTQALLKTLHLPALTVPHRAETPYLWDLWSEDERNHLADSLAGSMLSSLRPDVIMFDCYPFMPVAKMAAKLRIPIAVSVRKSTKPGFFDEMESLQRWIDLLIVAEEPSEMQVPESLRARTLFVGQVVRPATVTPEAARSGGSRRIVICGGGGGYPGTVHFYNLAGAAASLCRRRRPDLEIFLITGPLFKEWSDLKLTEGMTLIPFEPDMASRLAGADLVLCQAGYNTIAEITRIGVRTICVPAERHFDDQHERAERVAAEQDTFTVWRGEDAEGLSNLMATCLDALQRTPVLERLSSAGAGIAAKALLELAERSLSFPRASPRDR